MSWDPLPVPLNQDSTILSLKTGDVTEIDLENHQISVPGGVMNTAPVGELANIFAAYSLMRDKQE